MPWLTPEHCLTYEASQLTRYWGLPSKIKVDGSSPVVKRRGDNQMGTSLKSNFKSFIFPIKSSLWTKRLRETHTGKCHEIKLMPIVFCRWSAAISLGKKYKIRTQSYEKPTIKHVNGQLLYWPECEIYFWAFQMRETAWTAMKALWFWKLFLRPKMKMRPEPFNHK